MKRVHYTSGLIITTFISLHLFNHLYSLFGIEAHIQMMDRLRLVYRNIFVESILLLAILVQIITGLQLFRKKRKTVVGFFEKLHIWSGLYLAIFLAIHLSAVFGGRLVLDLDTNFYFGAAGINTFPFNLFFIPYYSLAVFSFLGHIAAIHATKMKKDILGISPEQQAYLYLVIGGVTILTMFYGLTNGFNGIALPKAYHVLIGQ